MGCGMCKDMCGWGIKMHVDCKCSCHKNDEDHEFFETDEQFRELVRRQV